MQLLDDAPFYSDSDSDESEEEEGDGKEAKPPKKKPYVMDPDLRLLLRNAKPLLQSRNAAVRDHVIWLLVTMVIT